MKKLLEFFKNDKRFLIILYFPIYMVWFELLEHRKTEVYIIKSVLDDYIPFCAPFIIPYMIWFFYVVIILLILALKPQSFLPIKNSGFFKYFYSSDVNDFYSCSIALIIGMTFSLIVYTIFPNGLNLRPENFVAHDYFTSVIAGLYKADTSTNVCPSLHVYNSLVVNYAFCTSKGINALNSTLKNILKIISNVLCILICLSTMFIKQHSIIDVICALVLFGIIYLIVYKIINLGGNNHGTER